MLSLYMTKYKTLIKIILIAIIVSSIVGGISYLSWQISQRQMDKERIATIAKERDGLLQAQKHASEELQRVQAILTAGEESKRLLSVKIDKILKEHRNAKPLPADCVIDADGVRNLTAAREAAISSASKPNN